MGVRVERDLCSCSFTVVHSREGIYMYMYMCVCNNRYRTTRSLARSLTELPYEILIKYNAHEMRIQVLYLNVYTTFGATTLTTLTMHTIGQEIETVQT